MDLKRYDTTKSPFLDTSTPFTLKFVIDLIQLQFHLSQGEAENDVASCDCASTSFDRFNRSLNLRTPQRHRHHWLV